MVRVHLSETKHVDVEDAHAAALANALEGNGNGDGFVTVEKRGGGGLTASFNVRSVLYTEQLADA